MYNNILFKNGHPLTYEKIPVEAFPGLSHELIHHGKFYREKLGNTDHSVTFIPTITSNKSFQEITVPEGNILSWEITVITVKIPDLMVL